MYGIDMKLCVITFICKQVSGYSLPIALKGNEDP